MEMKKITFDKSIYTCLPDELLLDALIRQGKEIPFSCRSGSCRVCMMRTTEGEVPESSKVGISAHLQRKGYFLPCQCRPENDLSIAVPRNADLACYAVVHEKKMLAQDVCSFLIEPSVSLYYHAGQFINIKNEKGDLRSYSLASVPHQDYYLELHVRRHPQGLMSRWLVDDVQPGDEIELIRPAGESYYRAEKHEPIMLVATGTGLAPLIGIARDALHSGHSGDIYLYHGARDQADLYADKVLCRLADEFSHFYYKPCLQDNGTVQNAIRLDHDDLHNFWVHLAGNPEMVSNTANMVQELGAKEEHILSDPFSVLEIDSTENVIDDTDQHNIHQDEAPYPPPAPDIWSALEDGVKLTRILDDFYDAVYEDAILSPYFHNSTKQRSKEKVYSFYKRLFSGEKVFFGDRPRNAHHWMVISNEIFIHREALLKSFMLKHKLPGDIIDKWMRIESRYRPDIVKDRARGRMIGGEEAPAGGYGTIELSVDSLCDACSSEIVTGTEVHYHLRTGETFCPDCFGNSNNMAQGE